MKLYNEYIKILSELSEIKSAWFTSFTLSPIFVETYIVPPLVSYDTKPIRPDEFEIIQQKINESNCNIRFFCDYRYLQTSETKKTSVPFHLIYPGKLSDKFSHGVFHPKVILLQDSNRKFYLITGSANLTLSGWAQNREAVFSAEIKTRTELKAIQNFFIPLFESVNEPMPTLRLGSEDNAEDLFIFVNSFQKTGFLDQFFENRQKELHLWSPYFSGDLPGLLDKELLIRADTVSIIPDINKNNKIRLQNNDSNKQLLHKENIRFFTHPSLEDDQSFNMTHAKVWLTNKRIAIGSWNCTEAALGVAKDSGNNIEAGIIADISGSDRRKLINELKEISINNLFMTSDELREEKEEQNNDGPPDLKITFDWEKKSYNIETACAVSDFDELKLKLPGIKNEIAISSRSFSVMAINLDEIIINKMYQILKRKKLQYSGYFLEINCSLRPVWKYKNINDLFQSVIENNFQSASDRQILRAMRYLEEMKIDDHIIDEENDEFTLTYFELFRAFKNYEERINDLKEDSPKDIVNIVRVYPNSLTAFKESIDAFMKNNPDKNVFQWFLLAEFNRLVELVLQKRNRFWPDYLEKELHDLMFPLFTLKAKSKAWLNYIQSKYYKIKRK